MAFADWPSSDGYGMLSYPWLGSARDQFVEHGHRLSGLTVGLLTICLVVFSWCVECGPVGRVIAVSIFGAVVIQGLLGGARVLLDRDVLALIHGDFGAGVFCLMCVLVLVTGSKWELRSRIESPKVSRSLLLLSLCVLSFMAVQYFLGGVLRHLRVGWAWWLHPWFAIAPAASAIVLVGYAKSSQSPTHVTRKSIWLLGFVCAQCVLGLMTWYVRYGVPAWGVVATTESVLQITICSAHKVVGMLTLMMSVICVVCIGGSMSMPRVETVSSSEEPVVLTTGGGAL